MESNGGHTSGSLAETVSTVSFGDLLIRPRFGFSCEALDYQREGTKEWYIDDELSEDEWRLIAGDYQVISSKQKISRG